jgi:hypothetical protein
LTSSEAHRVHHETMPSNKAVDRDCSLRRLHSRRAGFGRKPGRTKAVRLAAGNDRLADLVRRDQELAAQAEALDKAIIAAVSGATAKRDAAAKTATRRGLAAIAAERAALQKTLAVEFPDDAALSNPLPVKTTEIQSLLSDHEALVVFSVVEKQSYAIATTRTGFDWKPIGLGADDVATKVAAFRRARCRPFE